MPPALEQPACQHCGETLLVSQTQFCCAGCEAVYRLLHTRGLEKFYALREGVSPALKLAKPSAPTSQTPHTFAAWDTAAFRQTYAANQIFKAHLEGIHCLACLWLVENLGSLVPGLQSARLDFGRSIATFHLGPELSLEKLAEQLSAFGYRPTPLASDNQQAALTRKTTRKETVRLGVAALSASNIMLSSIPLYSGIKESLATLFLGISALLYLPVLFYAAVPFYENSWQKIKRGAPSIDLPIALALLGGGAFSYWNLFRGSEEVYFDSLSAIVFLLLSVRLLLRRVQSDALKPESDSLQTTSVQQILADGSTRFTLAASLQRGNRIQVFQDQRIPTDGVLRSHRAECDISILTGEALPLLTLQGETVYAGSSMRSPSAEIEVTEKGADSRLGRVLAQTQAVSALGTRWASLSDRVGRGFVAAVFALITAVVALKLGGTWQETVRRVLAISVVSCPCAFAFAVPLAMVLALRRLAESGVFVHSPAALEKLASLRTIFLDKTGTLTEGRLEVVQWDWLADESPSKNAVYSIEKLSRHPVARALVTSLRDATELKVSSFKEQIGVGVEGVVAGVTYRIRAAKQSGDPGVSIVEVLRTDDNFETPVATACLKDTIREGSASAVKQLKGLGIQPWLLSGDGESAVHEVAMAVGIDSSRALARLSPESKADKVKNSPHSLMVGDGANDAIALAQADVGVAVSGGVEWSLRAADIYLTRSGVMPVVGLVRFGRRLRNVILTNLAVSVAFNATAITLAATGRLSPLFAAVFMPVSSFSVLCITWLGMRKKLC